MSTRRLARRALSIDLDSGAIQSDRVRDLSKIQSEGYRQVEEIRGVADVKATEIYAAAYNRSPQSVEFYEFTRTMPSCRTIIAESKALVLSTDSELFRFLKRMASPSRCLDWRGGWEDIARSDFATASDGVLRIAQVTAGSCAFVLSAAGAALRGGADAGRTARRDGRFLVLKKRHTCPRYTESRKTYASRSSMLRKGCRVSSFEWRYWPGYQDADAVQGMKSC